MFVCIELSWHFILIWKAIMHKSFICLAELHKGTHLGNIYLSIFFNLCKPSAYDQVNLTGCYLHLLSAQCWHL
jgi:hypothetical protein